MAARSFQGDAAVGVRANGERIIRLSPGCKRLYQDVLAAHALHVGADANMSTCYSNEDEQNTAAPLTISLF